MTNQTVDHNVETGEIIERQATVEEIANIENMKAKRETIEAEKLAKEFAKSDLLKKLGITAEEAALLLG